VPLEPWVISGEGVPVYGESWSIGGLPEPREGVWHVVDLLVGLGATRHRRDLLVGVPSYEPSDPCLGLAIPHCDLEKLIAWDSSQKGSRLSERKGWFRICCTSPRAGSRALRAAAWGQIGGGRDLRDVPGLAAVPPPHPPQALAEPRRLPGPGQSGEGSAGGDRGRATPPATRHRRAAGGSAR
jgi:hypothetical protein